MSNFKKMCFFAAVAGLMLSVTVFAAEPIEPPRVFSESGTVVKVVDGDTIDLDIFGAVKRIRLIGINTPETVDPRRPVECFGKEASAFAEKTLDGKTVKLKSDSSQDNRDKYDRLLRYVWFEDEDGELTLFNLLMIQEGYAYEYTYQVPYQYQEQFEATQQKAEKTQAGLWHPDTCDGQKQAESESRRVEPSSSDGPQVDCSGNRYNCGDFKTHREAQAVFDACYPKHGDVHRLDRDKDDLACESLP